MIARLLVVVALVAGCHHPRACRDNTSCAADESCTFARGLCGHGKRPGTCRPRARDCDGAYRPVCGCDGNVYDSACTASAAGVDLAVNGGCKGPHAPGWIACGAHFCDAHSEYCEIVLSDVVDPPTDYACKPLPPACRPDGELARRCDCFPAATRCRSFCGPLDSGGVSGFHLTCRL